MQLWMIKRELVGMVGQGAGIITNFHAEAFTMNTIKLGEKKTGQRTDELAPTKAPSTAGAPEGSPYR